MIFAVARKVGFTDDSTRLEHMGFGTVNGKEACPVLDADDETAKNSRLKLSALTANVFQESLRLLGIETLERM